MLRGKHIWLKGLNCVAWLYHHKWNINAEQSSWWKICLKMDALFCHALNRNTFRGKLDVGLSRGGRLANWWKRRVCFAPKLRKLFPFPPLPNTLHATHIFFLLYQIKVSHEVENKHNRLQSSRRQKLLILAASFFLGFLLFLSTFSFIYLVFYLSIYLFLFFIRSKAHSKNVIFFKICLFFSAFSLNYFPTSFIFIQLLFY